jgi:hypothetical protein
VNYGHALACTPSAVRHVYASAWHSSHVCYSYLQSTVYAHLRCRPFRFRTALPSSQHVRYPLRPFGSCALDSVARSHHARPHYNDTLKRQRLVMHEHRLAPRTSPQARGLPPQHGHPHRASPFLPFLCLYLRTTTSLSNGEPITQVLEVRTRSSVCDSYLGPNRCVRTNDRLSMRVA